MAIAFRDKGSTSSLSGVTTIAFFAPATVVAGDVWLCSAGFRGGTGNTISTVGSGLNPVVTGGRIDSGTTITAVGYWYVALGTETPNASFNSITLTGGKLYGSATVAFSGVNTTTPFVTSGTSSLAGTGTTASTGTLPAGTAVWATWSWGSSGAVTATSPLVLDDTFNGGSGQGSTSFGAAHDVGSLSSQAWTGVSTSGTNVGMGAILNPASTGPAAPVGEQLIVGQSVARASYF